MGQKTVRFSDLSGQLIMRDDALARIVIHEHPDLGEGPVEIEALADEALALEKDALRVAVLDVYLPGEDVPRRITMDADAFGATVTEKPVSEMLTAARPGSSGCLGRPGRPGRPSSPIAAPWRGQVRCPTVCPWRIRNQTAGLSSPRPTGARCAPRMRTATRWPRCSGWLRATDGCPRTNWTSAWSGRSPPGRTQN